MGDRGRVVLGARLAARRREDLGHARAAVDVLSSGGQPEQVEHRRPEVDVGGALAITTAGFASRNGKPKIERHLGDLGIHVARVSLDAALAERLAVIGRDDQQRVVEVAARVELAEQRVEHLVHVQDRVVVDVGVGGAELRGLGVVGVLVHVHQVQVEEPALVAVDAQELDRGLDDVHVGAAVASRVGFSRRTSIGGAAAARAACRRRSPGRSRNSPRPSRCARCPRCGSPRRGRSRPRSAPRAGARRRSA